MSKKWLRTKKHETIILGLNRDFDLVSKDQKSGASFQKKAKHGIFFFYFDKLAKRLKLQRNGNLVRKFPLKV